MNVTTIDRLRIEEAETALIRLTVAAADLAILPLTADTACQLAVIAHQIEEVAAPHSK